MRYLLALLIMPCLVLANSLDDVKSTLISKIAEALVKKKIVNIYTNDSTYEMLHKFPYRFNLVESCDEADMVLTPDVELPKNECRMSKALVLMTHYRGYTQSKEAVGALFWQKGRPNLIFDKSRLQELSLVLSHAFSKYIE